MNRSFDKRAEGAGAGPEERWRERRSPGDDDPQRLRGYEHSAEGRRFETPRERMERMERRRYEMGTVGLPSTYGNLPYDPLRRPGQPWRGRDEEHDFWGQERHPHDEAHPSLWARMKGVFTGRGPKNYVRSDERIREDVCEHLADHPYIDASEIEVSVQAGEVTLAGTVDARLVKRAAEDCVEQVRGVKDVHNQLRVKSPPPPMR